MKAQTKRNTRKAKQALPHIFDIKRDKLEVRIKGEDELLTKPKSSKREKSRADTINQLHQEITQTGQTTEAASEAPVTVATEVAESLTDFASEADTTNQMHRELQQLGMTMLERMFQIGERLFRIKNQFPHGTWEEWIDDHLTMTSRTARRYIRAYKHRGDPLVTADPVLFLQEIHGNTEPKSDKTKSDVNVRFTGEGSPESESGEELRKSKPDRRRLHKHWARTVSDAKEAIEQLLDLQNQYAEWLDELAGDSRTSKLGDALVTVAQLTLSDALDLIKRAAAIELP